MFNRVAQWAAQAAGKGVTFGVAALLVVVWGASGPLFHFSQTWQLVINTGTTIVTFLMVFLIQNSQNRDTAAMQIKLNELLRATEGARSTLLNLEALPQEELQALQKEYQELARRRQQDGGAGHDPAHGTDR